MMEGGEVMHDFLSSQHWRYLEETIESPSDTASFGGVIVTYQELYYAMVFLLALFLSGHFVSYVLGMPKLVGEIVCGLLLGPSLANFAPLCPTTWVLLGQIGILLLVLEAGINVDVDMLKLVGPRGFLIAIVGSILPIAIGTMIAYFLLVWNNEGDNTLITSAFAAGCTFGPTSAGIALSILGSNNVLETPVGQMIVAAAIIDDMLALIVLSQLQSLVGEMTIVNVVVPIVSAFLFLFGGGYIALIFVPPVMNTFHRVAAVDPENKGKVELAFVFALVLVLMPATYYAKASYLMGAFLAGLSFCTSTELQDTFQSQMKRLSQWLMRLFFAATIGFQVPVREFANATVIWQGCVFALAPFLGKFAVGLLVPNFSVSAAASTTTAIESPSDQRQQKSPLSHDQQQQCSSPTTTTATNSKHFRGTHLRDCLITSCSMASEGEFAFTIAVFTVDTGLIAKHTYASVVLAILLTAILPPFALRSVIRYYNIGNKQQPEECYDDDDDGDDDSADDSISIMQKEYDQDGNSNESGDGKEEEELKE